ncbi:hypothetical protein [Polynucleobacter yangtzensis]|uniref:Uncharacterized protein n=1 Tax=Polynucleobacter yangtzensis TaxID=1743159 RepID=A0ABM8CMU3_9BURK|nr:hypothetical protein [Polynucleobacter yangtzensis]BDT79222.1 hypothetical protein PKF032_11100 [Polynucleobacter yangtzensis]
MTKKAQEFKIQYSFDDGTQESVPYDKVLESLLNQAKLMQERGDPSMMRKLLADLASSHGSRIMEKSNKAAAKIGNGKAPSKDELLAEIASITNNSQDKALTIKAKNKLAKKYGVKYRTIHKKIS